MRLFQYDDPEHREVASLLPWFANGTLDDAEQAKVRRHLTRCLACNQELARLRKLRTMFLQEDSDPQATQGLARIQARIGQVESGSGARARLRTLAMQWRAARPWLRGAIIAQFLILLLSTAALLRQPVPHVYHTLGTADAPASSYASLAVVFNSARPERDIRAVLLRFHARITDGPSSGGKYTLEVPAAEQERLLAQLRHMGLVVLAEPRSSQLPTSR